MSSTDAALRRSFVSVSPSAASVAPGAALQLTATVTGSTNTAVTWSVQEGSAGGTVTATGLYTAPAATGTYHVVAKSQADSRRSATATVTVAAPSTTPSPSVAVTVSPSSTALQTSAALTFTASVSGTTNGAVTWSVQESGGGTVTSSGVYTAPGAAGTYHVVARSQADSTQSASATVTVSAPSTTTSGQWVSGYYAGYQKDLYPPAAVDFSAMTHLIMAAAQPRTDGTLDTSFYVDSVNGPALAKDLASRAHAAGRKALIMIGGAGAEAGFQGASSSANRARFVQNLLSMVQSLGYDGLDLDWEPVSDADKPLALALAHDLRAASPGIILTFPVTIVNVNFGAADPWYAQLAAYLDQLNIMTYGMANAWPGWLSWHGSALDGEGGTYPTSVSSSADGYAAVGVPKSKIGVGIGFYGSCWRGPTGPRQSPGSGVVADDNVMSYANIMSTYYSSAAYHWDSVASAGYLSFSTATGPQGCTFVSYEDEASISAKGQWVRANGYGGTIIWTVNQGYVSATGTNPPLTAVKAAFLQ